MEVHYNIGREEDKLLFFFLALLSSFFAGLVRCAFIDFLWSQVQTSMSIYEGGGVYNEMQEMKHKIIRKGQANPFKVTVSTQTQKNLTL